MAKMGAVPNPVNREISMLFLHHLLKTNSEESREEFMKKRRTPVLKNESQNPYSSRAKGRCIKMNNAARKMPFHDSALPPHRCPTNAKEHITVARTAEIGACTHQQKKLKANKVKTQLTLRTQKYSQRRGIHMKNLVAPHHTIKHNNPM
jgi:hypothetical protein